MGTLVQNVRFALRQWRQSPGFVAMAVLTLALGIGGTTAIFMLIDAVTFRLLPVSHPERLYRIGDGANCCVDGGPQDRWGLFSFSLYERLKAEAPEFEQVAAFRASVAPVSVRQEGAGTATQALLFEYVTGNYFSTLGVGAFGGRLFTPNDDRTEAPSVAVLSHHAWQSKYGADPSVVGSTLVVEGHPFTVIGVAAPGFFGETPGQFPPDLWIPLQQESLFAGEGALLRQPVVAWLRVIGRLRPGASITGIAPRLTGILRQWLRSNPGYPANFMPDIVRMLPQQVINVVPGGTGVAVMKEAYGRTLSILLSVCGLVLLIACANVANLLLARAASRRAQTALQVATGATRRQIVLQAIVESVLLAGAGGIVGLGFSITAAKLMLTLAFGNTTFVPIGATPSLAVVSFAFGLMLLAGIVSGTAPAWLATRTDPAQVLRGSSRNSGYHSSFASKSLVVVQATLSVVLVAGAAMLVRSLRKLNRQDLGFPTQGRVLVHVNHLPDTYTFPKLTALYRQVEERLQQMPGVQKAGLALYSPLEGGWTDLVVVAGHPLRRLDDGEGGTNWDRIGAGYLQKLGAQLVRGREFTAADNENAERVAVVNEAFVRRFFSSGEDPLDRHFGLGSPQYAGTYRIVGIVRDVKFVPWSLRQPAPAMFFVPLAQSVEYTEKSLQNVELRSHRIGGIMLVTDVSPGTLEPLLRKALTEIDPNLTITGVASMQEQVERVLDQDRAVARLATIFGVVALLLAAVGLYAVMSYTVAQRTSEIGVRMALGARRAEVLRFVLRGAFRRVLAGLALGLPLAVVAGRLISTSLYGVRSWDPLALAVAAGTLAFSAFFAAIVPASRAAAIEPMEALRME